VLAIDEDEPGSDLLDHLVVALRVAGESPVLVASGREGHRHLFCRCDLAHWTKQAREIGIPAGALRAVIRPPLAPHRLGLPVALLEPTDPIEALIGLAPQGDESASKRIRRGLSPRMYQLLREG
jgi:hypothetical protein